MSLYEQLPVPIELTSTLFFKENTVAINQNEWKEWKELSSFTAFPYDFVYYHGIEGYHPWNESEKHVSHLLSEWKKIDVQCQKLFSERKTKQALDPMKEGIALFFTFLFWIHNQPVQLKEWEEKVKQLPVQPVNLVERLTFIIQRPALYHSYIQLSELFREQEKHYVKSRIKKSPRP